MKKLKIVVAVIVVLILGIIIWYKVSLMPVNSKNIENSIRVEIEEGMRSSKILDLLEKNDVIKSSTAAKIYIKLNNKTNLQAGKYDFYNKESTKEIIEHIVKGEVVDDSVKITFIEGKNIKYVAKLISEKTNNSEDDVYNLLKDEEYIDSLIEKYWFLTDDIKNEDIYYPLEGYLLPDTYTFEDKNVDVKTIFNIILNFTEKALNKYKDTISDKKLNIHEIITLASMAELEGENKDDRAEIVGVFLNRIKENMSLGSDVTTYYAFGVDMGESDLTKKQLNTENPYNTRGPNMRGKLPVGPICNPSIDAIDATINYKETDALYFVADKKGKVYFSKTNEEHTKIIKELKDNNLWHVYE